MVNVLVLVLEGPRVSRKDKNIIRVTKGSRFYEMWGAHTYRNRVYCESPQHHLSLCPKEPSFLTISAC
jgi:hypothetical protein